MVLCDTLVSYLETTFMKGDAPKVCMHVLAVLEQCISIRYVIKSNEESSQLNEVAYYSTREAHK